MSGWWSLHDPKTPPLAAQHLLTDSRERMGLKRVSRLAKQPACAAAPSRGAVSLCLSGLDRRSRPPRSIADIHTLNYCLHSSTLDSESQWLYDCAFWVTWLHSDSGSPRVISWGACTGADNRSVYRDLSARLAAPTPAKARNATNAAATRACEFNSGAVIERTIDSLLGHNSNYVQRKQARRPSAVR